jgi:hypothetical protein
MTAIGALCCYSKTVCFGSRETILNDSFEEMRLLDQIAASHKLHSGSSAEVHSIKKLNELRPDLLFITIRREPTINIGFKKKKTCQNQNPQYYYTEARARIITIRNNC